MSFTSVNYLLWLGLLAFLYRICPSRGRVLFLLLASYLFYFSTGVFGLTLLAGASLFTFGSGLAISRWRHRARIGVIVSIAVILLAFYLLFFKAYAAFRPAGTLAWLMPLGLSYYTFKLIGYLLDVYWDKIPVQTRVLEFLAFVAFFPQIVAGPIQRAESFFEQSHQPASVAPGFLRIAWGLAKKLIIADHLGPAVAYAFAHATDSHAPLWIGFYIWPLQLYADFSGLTDIAIGSGLLFGIRGPENFDRPFTATNIADYWRRWHMSLTHWLVDYLFLPLRMTMRWAGNAGLVASISINMIAIGLWHGFSLCYLVFGVLHSIFMSVEALTSRLRRSWFKQHQRWDALGNALGWLLTFHLVALALVFFRADSVPHAIALLKNMIAGFFYMSASLASLGPHISSGFGVGLVGYLLLELCERFRPDLWIGEQCHSGARWVRWSVYASAVAIALAGIALMFATGGGSKNPFVYAIF